ncbi:Hypothetical predicted protein [Podarcis lilfordi]|uniref:Uncharacterized protein n=1 Tax=Podarcis lilfordi TaxID=74358 RepID=A0AA35P4N9_9SAUR|nr:Hypothetical predicted protein [Podarcis lilfordi]
MRMIFILQWTHYALGERGARSVLDLMEKSLDRKPKGNMHPMAAKKTSICELIQEMVSCNLKENWKWIGTLRSWVIMP